MPALLMRMSTRPNADIAASTTSCTCAWSDTSQTFPSTRNPRDRNSSSAGVSHCSRRAHNIKSAPASASASAISNPRPREPPVTMAARPVRWKSCCTCIRCQPPGLLASKPPRRPGGSEAWRLSLKRQLRADLNLPARERLFVDAVGRQRCARERAASEDVVDLGLVGAVEEIERVDDRFERHAARAEREALRQTRVDDDLV